MLHLMLGMGKRYALLSLCVPSSSWSTTFPLDPLVKKKTVKSRVLETPSPPPSIKNQILDLCVPMNCAGPRPIFWFRLFGAAEGLYVMHVHATSFIPIGSALEFA